MLKTLASYLGKYKKIVIFVPIIMVIEVILELFLPRVMARIVDIGIPAGDMPYIAKMGLIMVIISCISMVMGVLGAKYAAISSQGFGANLRQGLFDKIQSFSFADIDRFSSGSLITRITNDVNQLTMMLAMGQRMLVRAPVMFVAAMVMAFRINARTAAVLLVIIPVMILIIVLLMRLCTKLFGVVQSRLDNLNNTIQENLVAIRVVKAFVRSGYEKTKFIQSNDALMEIALKVGTRIVLIMPLMQVCMYAALVAVLRVGGGQVMGGTLLVGDLSSIITYINQILFSVMLVAMSMLILSRSIACARRVCEVLAHEPDVEDKPDAAETELSPAAGKVEFRDVSFKYVTSGTGDDVLSHIDLTIEPGEFVAIVGGTGTGKSSLVNLIPRFYDVTGGAVLVDGVDVRDYPLEELRGRIGMVLQTNVLFTGTIRENLLWGKEDATEEEMIQAAKDAQAYDFIMSFPDGFDTVLDQGGTNVSGGQKQRLCIARAMLRQPSILILDDSTSAVDSATEAAIRESFHTNLKDTTVIIIAQRISSVQYADKIVILDDDHIVGLGNHETLLKENKIYQEIYQSQLEGVQE